MANLFAFGCSHTYGHGLSDCIIFPDLPGPKPSKLTYVDKLAEHLDIARVINTAGPGKSNKWILNALETYIDLIKKDDVVIIQWSYLERSAILGNESKENYRKTIDIGPWKKDRLSQEYYKTIYHKHDHEKQTIWYINYAGFLLNHRGIKNVLHTAPPGSNLEEFIIDKRSFWNTCLSDHSIDYADDKKHPGPKSHKKFAKMIYNRRKFTLTGNFHG